MQINFNLDIEINDQRAFFEAALDSFCADGVENLEGAWEFFLLDDGSPNWTACAIELLDHGSGFEEGYQVINSGAEIVAQSA